MLEFLFSSKTSCASNRIIMDNTGQWIIRIHVTWTNLEPLIARFGKYPRGSRLNSFFCSQYRFFFIYFHILFRISVSVPPSFLDRFAKTIYQLFIHTFHKWVLRLPWFRYGPNGSNGQSFRVLSSICGTFSVHRPGKYFTRHFQPTTRQNNQTIPISFTDIGIIQQVNFSQNIPLLSLFVI